MLETATRSTRIDRMMDLLLREAQPVYSGRHGTKLIIFEAVVRRIDLEVFLQLLNLDVEYLVDANDEKQNIRICAFGISAFADYFLASQRWHE